jgi:hypothetical protein
MACKSKIKFIKCSISLCLFLNVDNKYHWGGGKRPANSKSLIHS